MQGIRTSLAVFFALTVGGTGIALAQSDPAGESPSVAAEALSAPPELRSTELEAKRTATSQTFELPSGALETRIYEAPVNYRDADGSWEPIEEGSSPLVPVLPTARTALK